MTCHIVHYCRKCRGPLHKSLWPAGEHSDCQDYGEPRNVPRDNSPVMVPEELPPLDAEGPLHVPTAEISEVWARNRWE